MTWNWVFSVPTPPPPDSFTSGIYLPSTTSSSPDIGNGVALLSGFVRGLTGTVTWSSTNVGGGAAYCSVTPSSGSNYASLLAASGLTAAAAGTYQVDVAATNGVTTYTQRVTITKLATGANVAVAGGNVLRATSNPGVAPNGPTLVVKTNPTYTSTGDPQLPDNTFSSYMRFFGNGALGNQYGAQAYIDDVPSTTGPLFIVGFFRPEAEQSNWAISTYGINSLRVRGQMVLSMSYTVAGVFPPAVDLYEFMWKSPDNTFIYVGFGGPDITVPGSANSNSVFNVWQCFASILNPPVDSNTTYWIDGVYAANQGNVQAWPTAAGADVFALTFGSFGARNAGASAGDNHSGSGGYRDVAAVTGVPTALELEAFRLGGDPLTIWSGRVWGKWAFNTDPRSSVTIPDLSGNNHPLTLVDLGNTAGHALPYLVTYGVPYIMDGYGPAGTNLFALVDVGGGNYQIRTRAGLTPSDYYGTYTNVVIVANGYQFSTTLYVNDGS